ELDTARHDFESWLPKMRARGVVLLHDTNERTRDFGVWKLWSQLESRYPGFELPYGHGLGLLAVGDEPDPRIVELIELARTSTSVIDLLSPLGERVALMGRETAHLLEIHE